MLITYFIFFIDAATQTDAPKKSKLAAHFSNSSTILCSTSDKQIQANLSSVSNCNRNLKNKNLEPVDDLLKR
jgi:hypothetical protein